jgi:hypothetical protein
MKQQVFKMQRELDTQINLESEVAGLIHNGLLKMDNNSKVT